MSNAVTNSLRLLPCAIALTLLVIAWGGDAVRPRSDPREGRPAT